MTGMRTLEVSVASQHDVVERIHASGRGCVVSFTGGGSQAIADLLTVPGASATMLEAVVPYSAAALAEWLGGKSRSGLQRTDRPGDGDGRLRAGAQAVGRRSDDAARHRRDGEPRHDAAEARAASNPRGLAIGGGDGFVLV